MSKKNFVMAAGILILAGGLVGQNEDWSTTGNSGTDPSTHFLGTTDNKALVMKVYARQAMRLEPRSINTPVIIGGCWANSIHNSLEGATIGGGGSGSFPNTINGDGEYATIAGGLDNTVSGYGATIGGGTGNESSGNRSTIAGGRNNSASAYYSVVSGGMGNTVNQDYGVIGGGYYNSATDKYTSIGGGKNNEATDYAATVAGGQDNKASGYRSTVGGGYSNEASGDISTIPGGYDNEASQSCTFAAGYRAKADDQGSFVWGDIQPADIASTGPNEFIVRAHSGIWFGTNSSPSTPYGRFINTSTGGYLSSGGTWTNASDKNLKEGFCPVDEAEILEKVAELPITTWNYKEEDASIQHIGPVGQDFHAAFGVGADDKSISTVDAEGVALAAIQALYKENQELKKQVDDLTERLEALEKAER